ncbi:MAG: SpoIIIAH-like family protein [Dehalobacterium sp.]
MKMFFVKKKNLFIGILFLGFLWLGYQVLDLHQLVENDKVEETSGKIEIQPDFTFEADEHEFFTNKHGQETTDQYDVFFVNYRIEREKMRSQQIEIMREIVDNPNSSTEMRQNAQEQMLMLTRSMENELKLENLIKAKNFEEAVVLIQPETVMVVLKGSELTQGESTRIADLVANTTGHPYEQISITTKD